MTTINELAEDERQQLLAALYGEDNAPTKKEVHIDPSGFNRIKKIRFGAITYDVPSMEYVLRLEQLVSNQAQKITRMEHALNKLERMINGTRKFIKSQSKHINEMQIDLDQKIDIRE